MAIESLRDQFSAVPLSSSGDHVLSVVFSLLYLRVQYARWKNECREIFPVVGSGKFITAPVITEGGQPIQDPLVLLETNPGKLLALYLFKNNSFLKVK